MRIGVISGQAGVYGCVAADLQRVRTVERAVVCTPCGIHMFGAHGSDAPYYKRAHAAAATAR